ncbi:telomere stability and silencing-domain-containing protein [Amylocystis lapponica]|nr:telomere stability and silencing-domain-containing protein [Amylocystis lapponica]
MSTSVLVSTFPPFPTLTLFAPADTTFGALYDLLADRYSDLPADLVLSSHRGAPPASDALLSSLHPVEVAQDNGTPLVSLRLVPRLRGGKGGFGSQLRAAGGRMSSQKTSNNDSCRDLSGRRLSTIKEAKRLAEYIENEPARKKAQQEAQKAKLEALEKRLGIVSGGDGAGPSTPEAVAGKKHRFDDTEYLEQSRDIVDNVKSAVTVAMLKKRKKAKTSHSPPTATPSDGPASATAATGASVSEKILESPTTAPVVAVASAVAGFASA